MAGAIMSLGDASSQAQAPAQPRPADRPGQETGDAPAETGAVSGPPAGASPAARTRWLSGHIEQLIAERPALADARIAVHIRDIAGEQVLYRRAADQPMSVASCSKVITAAAALAILGPNFRPTTAVLAEAVEPGGVIPGDLYLRGRGDPELAIGDLRRLADGLVRAGITRVGGQLILDDSYFDGDISPPHFDEQPDEQASFRAPVSALSPRYNAFAVYVRPAPGGQGAATAWLEPPGDYARIALSEVLTQPTGRNRIRLVNKVVDGRSQLTLTGQIRADSPVQRYRQRIADPLAFVGSVFRQMLRERDIRIGRRVRRGESPDDVQLLAMTSGPPVAVAVRSLG
ncbi:MAG: D-alanyl-D-alanine carboxypeptidase/D-alanyl-D-alanine-endopeptidase, partial [Myxococcota bacterium]